VSPKKLFGDAVTRRAEILGDVIQDAAQRADSQRVVTWDSDVVLVPSYCGGQS
jgi:hypothetical protein